MKLKGFSQQKAWIALWVAGALVLATTAFATTQQGAQKESQDKNETGAKIAKAISMATMVQGMLMFADGYMTFDKGSKKVAEGEELVAVGTSNAEQGCASAAAGNTADQPICDRGKQQVVDGNQKTSEGGKEKMQGTMGMLQGTMTTLQGMQGLLGAKKLQQNANTAARNAGRTDSLAKNGNDNIKLDPSFLKKEPLGKILDKFESKTGMSREALSDALDKGVDPFDLLAKTGIPKSAISQAQLKASEAMANGASVDPKQIGIDPNAIAQQFGGEGEFTAKGLESPSSNLSGLSNFDDLLNTNLQPPEQAGLLSGGVDPNSVGLSEDVQEALDRAGRTNKSLFEMISSNYRKRTAFMFGMETKTESKDKEPKRAPAAEVAEDRPIFKGTF